MAFLEDLRRGDAFLAQNVPGGAGRIKGCLAQVLHIRHGIFLCLTSVAESGRMNAYQNFA
jgi:hypothetical protein